MASGDHSFDDVPILLFGGSGVGLQADQFFDFGGRPTNDLWLSIAAVFGVELDGLGESSQFTGPLEGVFASG